MNNFSPDEFDYSWGPPEPSDDELEAQIHAASNAGAGLEVLMQLQETLHVLDECEFSPEERNIFLQLVGRLCDAYTDSSGEVERRKRQKNPFTNGREPELNHALSVVTLTFEILREAHEQISSLSPEMQDKIETLWRGRFRLLLDALCHDLVEDGKFDEASLGQLLISLNVEPNTALESVSDVSFLTRPEFLNGSDRRYQEDLPTYRRFKIK